jgi:hypothetical protein
MLNDFKKSYYCYSNWSYSHTSLGRWVDQLTQTFQASQNTPDAIATDGGFQRVIRGVNFDIICSHKINNNIRIRTFSFLYLHI